MAKVAPRSRSTSRMESKQADDPFSKVVELMSTLIIPAKYEAAHLKTQAEAVISLAKMIEGGELSQKSIDRVDSVKLSRFPLSQFLDFQVPLSVSPRVKILLVKSVTY